MWRRAETTTEKPGNCRSRKPAPCSVAVVAEVNPQRTAPTYRMTAEHRNADAQDGVADLEAAEAVRPTTAARCAAGCRFTAVGKDRRVDVIRVCSRISAGAVDASGVRSALKRLAAPRRAAIDVRSGAGGANQAKRDCRADSGDFNFVDHAGLQFRGICHDACV